MAKRKAMISRERIQQALRAIRVLVLAQYEQVADDQEIRRLVWSGAELQIARTVKTALAFAASCRPSAILLDSRFIAAIPRLLKASPGAHVVVSAQKFSTREGRRALRLGAASYVERRIGDDAAIQNLAAPQMHSQLQAEVIRARAA